MRGIENDFNAYVWPVWRTMALAENHGIHGTVRCNFCAAAPNFLPKILQFAKKIVPLHRDLQQITNYRVEL